MLKRYTLTPMQELWQEQTKFERWLDVELAVLKARVKLSMLEPAAYEAVRAHAKIALERIAALEAEYDHDMIAFIVAVQESLEATAAGAYVPEFHKGLTSYDIEDPALILLLREASKLILTEFERLESALRAQAEKHRWTLMVARTHGQFAEPSTFGHLLLVFAEAIRRSIGRLEHMMRTELGEGKISGAVGTYAGMDSLIELNALVELGMAPARAETQILQRDRHAAFIATLAIAAGTIEQMCRTFWEMMRSDVHELEEPRKPRQRGSSAMPQKKNPNITERLIGLARQVRSCVNPAMENIATPEWRAIEQSSVERHIFPIATGLLHYMASEATSLVENLRVFPERMRKHLEETSLGVWAGQPIRLALMDVGVPYDFAYTYVQASAFEATEHGVHLKDILSLRQLSDDDLRTAETILGRERLEQCFDARAYIERGINHIFRKEGSERV